MKDSVIRLLMALMLSACASFASGMDLYYGEAPINDESEAGQAAAIRQAFRQVLVKAAGSEQRIADPALAQEIAAAADHMLSYGFRDRTDNGTPQRWLQVQFSREAVERILARHNVPVWHAQRPRLLVWLGLEQGGERRIVQPGTDDNYQTLVRHAADARGLPTQFPLMDLEDQRRLSAEQLGAQQVEPLRDASERYGADVVLAGLLREDVGGAWSGRWQLLDDGRQAAWNNAGGSLSSMVYQALDVAADKLAQRYAPTPMATSGESLTIRIEDLRSARGYARIDGLINGLGSVALATVVRATPDSIDYRLQLRGEVAALEQELAHSGILRAVDGGAPSPAGAPAEMLRYQLSF